MTTIAVNKTSMACDLQFTHASGLKMKGASKVHTLSPELAKDMFGVKTAYVGFAGNADTWGDIVSWFSIPDQKMPKCRGIEMLLLTDGGKIYHGTNLRNWTTIDQPFFSIGSGMHLAMGAMNQGATPLEACKVASKHDPSTGMGFKEYKL